MPRSEDPESASRTALLARIAGALERLAPADELAPVAPADGYVWEPPALVPVPAIAHVPLALLKGIDAARDTLLENTRRFAQGLPANNALLWGARGMGKSSLVKAVHAEVNAALPPARRIVLAEIHREDIATLPQLLRRVRPLGQPVIVFCDDLSFTGEDANYKSLKSALEGGLEGRPANVLFYATSNRRHLMPREMTDNERATAIHPGEAVEEKVSLSDRFGLWLGFHACPQESYLTMVRAYAERFALPVGGAELDRRALEWAAQRGARSGRVAWQFVQDLAGALGRKLS